MRLSALSTTFAAGLGELVLRAIGKIAGVGTRRCSKAAGRRGRCRLMDMDEGHCAKEIALHCVGAI